jgi:hypothetical protein
VKAEGPSELLPSPWQMIRGVPTCGLSFFIDDLARGESADRPGEISVRLKSDFPKAWLCVKSSESSWC